MRKKKNKIIISLVIAIATVLLETTYIIHDKMLNKEENYISNMSNTVLDKYRNEDGTPGLQKQFYGENYKTKLNLKGDVEACYQENCNKITNLGNVKDMIEWKIAGPEEYQKIVFLLENGDLYVYTNNNYQNKNFTAEKLENINNIDRIIEYSYHGTQSGGNWGILAITKDNKYIEVCRESV